MIHVLLFAPQNNVRVALRLLLVNLDMQIVGEAADRETALQLAQDAQPDIVLIDLEIITPMTHNLLTQLRLICPAASIIVLANGLNTRHHTALSPKVDLILSKNEMPDQIAKRILAAGKRHFTDE